MRLSAIGNFDSNKRSTFSIARDTEVFKGGGSHQITTPYVTALLKATSEEVFMGIGFAVPVETAALMIGGPPY